MPGSGDAELVHGKSPEGTVVGAAVDNQGECLTITLDSGETIWSLSPGDWEAIDARNGGNVLTCARWDRLECGFQIRVGGAARHVPQHSACTVVNSTAGCRSHVRWKYVRWKFLRSRTTESKFVNFVSPSFAMRQGAPRNKQGLSYVGSHSQRTNRAAWSRTT